MIFPVWGLKFEFKREFMEKMIINIENLGDFTKNIANKIKEVKLPVFIGLKGEMGAGKTTFTRELIKNITNETDVVVTSPTFTLINVYETIPQIVHVDLFRLETYDDIIFSGIDYYMFESQSIIIAEWYDKINYLMPKNNIKININIVSEFEREFEVFYDLQ